MKLCLPLPSFWRQRPLYLATHSLSQHVLSISMSGEPCLPQHYTQCPVHNTCYVNVYDWISERKKTSLSCLSVQSLSCIRLFATPWITAHQASLSIINSQSSLKLMSIELVMPSNHLILCRPLLLLPPIPPSIRVFSNESTLRMRWPKDWGQEEKGTTEDEMAGWHHWLDGRESEWTPGVGDGQGGLACCDSWGRKESDTTERLNWTEVLPKVQYLTLDLVMMGPLFSHL